VQSRNILIITSDLDPHSDSAIVRLRNLGHNPIRFHPSEVPLVAHYHLTIGPSGTGGYLKTENQRVALEDIHSVWLRRPKPSVLPEGLASAERDFARREHSYCIRGLYSMLDCYWMSDPALLRAAELKTEQLRRAVRFGFEIPETIITMNPDAVRSFYDECAGRMIYKPLSDTFWGGKYFPTRLDLPVKTPKLAEEELPKMLRTTLVSSEFLAENVDCVQHAPCAFQKYIEKRCEYRVTVIGDEVFVAEIDSQVQDETRVDWRNYEVPMKIREGRLPDEVVRKCHAFVQSYGLEFSAMDIIHTPDDRYVFLENNPNGQWGFIQARVPKMKMLEALVDCLVKGRSHSKRREPVPAPLP